MARQSVLHAIHDNMCPLKARETLFEPLRAQLLFRHRAFGKSRVDSTCRLTTAGFAHLKNCPQCSQSYSVAYKLATEHWNVLEGFHISLLLGGKPIMILGVTRQGHYSGGFLGVFWGGGGFVWTIHASENEGCLTEIVESHPSMYLCYSCTQSLRGACAPVVDRYSDFRRG